jgi:hypothetical protein
MKMGLKGKLYNVKKVLEHAIDGHAIARNILKGNKVSMYTPMHLHPIS